MQRHCIEVATNATDELNSDQVTVDASHQPVYVLSRRSQQMFPDFLGPEKYLPMFGGLHIETFFREIHRQVIAVSGLAKFLDQTKEGF